MKFKKIDFDKYNEIRMLLLAGSEGNEEEIYMDSNIKATIGIGINIEDNKGLWRYIILCYLFGITKKPDEISFMRFDEINKIKAQIIKNFEDKESYKKKEYERLIDSIHSFFGKEIVVENGIRKENNINTKKLSKQHLSKHLSKNIQDGIETYIKESFQKQIDNKKIERLNEADLKISKDNNGKNKYLEFRLNEKQAKEIFNILAINYEAITLSHLKNKQIDSFNAIKEKDNKREYYREFIPLLSATYKAPNIIASNPFIKESFRFKSRFLLWASIRYTLGNDIRRRLLQSLIFNLNNKIENEIENEIEKLNTCISIFKVLNLSQNITQDKQSYLEYFERLDEDVVKVAIKERDYCKNNPKNKNCKIYRCINPNELQSLRDILNYYMKYLNEIIPQAKFETNKDFKKIEIITQENNKQKNTQKIESRFKLHNIYIVDNTNYIQVAQALKNYKNNEKENLLIFIVEKINCELKFEKPNNAYLYLISVKENTIDCAFLNNPLKECIKENDDCELFFYNEHKITSLATQEPIELNENYFFDKSNHLHIKKNKEIYLTLINYNFYLKNHILITHLKPNQIYSNLGIELKAKEAQETFSNNGNYEIQIKNIDLKNIKSAISKDSPIFCYVQENKQNFIAKLKDNSMTLKIHLNTATQKDSKKNLVLQNPKFIFLSFIPFENNTQANHIISQKIQLLGEDLERGYKKIDFKVPLLSLEKSEVFRKWEEEISTTFYQLEKTDGRIYNIDLLNSCINNELLAEIKKDKKENKTRILKSFKKVNNTTQIQDTRKIAFSTIDIINRKDMSKNPLIYKALDKLILDYQKYKDNFPQDYCVEFGKYMVESGIQGKKGLLYARILESLTECCELIANSFIFGDKEYKNGGIAIYHLYENYVPKFEGDENGLDKVSHFLFSALIAFRDNVIAANIASVGNEIVDWVKQKSGGDGTGFNMNDIKANNAGISYGAELKERAIKGILQ